MSARWWSLVVWALAAASAVYWGFKLFVTPIGAPAHTQTAAPGGLARGDFSRILGVDAPPPAAPVIAEPAADARFQLVGVVSPRSPGAAREGLALIAIDGKPAKTFRVGSVVEGDNVLQAVAQRGATLGPRGGAALVALNIAPPADAARGTMPAATADGGAAPALPPQALPPPTSQPFTMPRMAQPRSGPPPVQPTQPAMQRRPMQPAQDADSNSGQGADMTLTR